MVVVVGTRPRRWRLVVATLCRRDGPAAAGAPAAVNTSGRGDGAEGKAPVTLPAPPLTPKPPLPAAAAPGPVLLLPLAARGTPRGP